MRGSSLVLLVALVGVVGAIALMEESERSQVDRAVEHALSARVDFLHRLGTHEPEYRVLGETLPSLPMTAGTAIKVRGDGTGRLSLAIFYLCPGAEPWLLHSTDEPVDIREFIFPEGDPESVESPGWLTFDNDSPLETHTIVVLGRRDGALDCEDLKRRLQDLGPAPTVEEDLLLVCDHDQVDTFVHGLGSTRGIDFSRTKTDELNILHRLEEAFGTDHDLVRAVAFPQRIR